eukprot:SAG11_NODE_465_length_9217_cov_93.852161_4_plen_75_part_00
MKKMIIDMYKYLENNKLNHKHYFFCVRKYYYEPLETHVYLYKANLKECEDFIEQDKNKIRLTGEPDYEICFDKR